MELPKFHLKLHTGEDITDKDLRGHRVVLFSYPKAFTPGCTKEVCSIEDSFSQIKNHNVLIFGISTDPVEKNREFAEKYNLEYPLISDPEHELLEKLGMFGERTLYGKKFMGTKRYIHFFDENGMLVKTIKGVKTANAGEQILNAFKQLNW